MRKAGGGGLVTTVPFSVNHFSLLTHLFCVYFCPYLFSLSSTSKFPLIFPLSSFFFATYPFSLPLVTFFLLPFHLFRPSDMSRQSPREEQRINNTLYTPLDKNIQHGWSKEIRSTFRKQLSSYGERCTKNGKKFPSYDCFNILGICMREREKERERGEARRRIY